jgi:hypothetical protein
MSSVILIRPSHTNGLLWEFEQVVKNKYLDKTILYLQMGSENEIELQEARYRIFLRKINSLNMSFPSYNPKNPLIFFSSGQIFACNSWNDIPICNSLISK